MATLKDFMIKPTNETKEVKVGEFPAPFKIRRITAEERQQIEKECVTVRRTRRGNERDIDTEKWQNKIIARAIVYPDLNAKELQDFYDVMGAEQLVMKIFNLPGDYDTILENILDFSGMLRPFEDEVNEAKN